MNAEKSYLGSFKSPDQDLTLNNYIKFNTFLLGSDANIFTSNNGFLILFGKIYNLDEISQGHSIEYQTQSEGIFKLYTQLSEKLFYLLDGDFTLFFSYNNTIQVVRDRHGAGPQFYYSDKYFTSHPSLFKHIKKFNLEINQNALYTFLALGYIPSPDSILDGVSKLKPGSILKVENDNITVKELFTWDYFKQDINYKITEDEALEEYHRLHKKSIANRIKGKEKVSLLLSGGYDSGGNINALRQIYSGPIKSYSIGFKDNPWTEVPLAKLMAERYDADFKSYEINGSEIEFLPEILKEIGDPFQEGGLMVNYTAMKMISEDKPDIILGGDGNDQHFGTFGKELAINHIFHKYGLNIAQSLFLGLSENNLFNNDNLLFKLKFHNEKISSILQSDRFGFYDFQLKSLLIEPVDFKQFNYTYAIPKKYRNYDEFYRVRNHFIDIQQNANEIIIHKASRMASLFQNNITFPYMSTELYDFLKTMPRNFKCKGEINDLAKGKGVAKYLLKKILKPQLPTEITSRKKQGGFAPLPLFFKDHSKRKELYSIILSSEIIKKLFNKTQLNSFFNHYDKLSNQTPYWFWNQQVMAFRLFNLLVIALWWDANFND